MDKQRLRNLTTGRLHTEMGHVYQDIEYITDEVGIMTHQLPNAMRAMGPWLKEKVTDPEFWDGEYRPEIKGFYSLEPMNDKEKAEFFLRYGELPSPLQRFL